MSPKVSIVVVINYFVITSADLDGAGARSKLDAVLKGLVEKSENERLAKLIVVHIIIIESSYS